MPSRLQVIGSTLVSMLMLGHKMSAVRTCRRVLGQPGLHSGLGCPNGAVLSRAGSAMQIIGVKSSLDRRNDALNTIDLLAQPTPRPSLSAHADSLASSRSLASLASSRGSMPVTPRARESIFLGSLSNFTSIATDVELLGDDDELLAAAAQVCPGAIARRLFAATVVSPF